MSFNFREFALSKSKVYKTEVKTKLPIPDPSGLQNPIKVVLSGSCDPTDEGYIGLCLEQDKNKKIMGKQRQPETEKGRMVGTLTIPFHPEEIGGLIASLVENEVEDLASDQTEAHKEESKHKKTKKEVNRVSELVGANGASE